MPYTYILECADGSYYVGSTWLADVEERVRQHNTADLGAIYTRRRRPVVLVWAAWFDRMEDAFAFEKRVQGWSRAKRQALIDGRFDRLPGLSHSASQPDHRRRTT
jgi:putative endonuclease